MVHDHVPEGADRVVEVATILHPEGLRHGDLHALDVVTVPDGIQDRVREPQVEDLGEPHLPEEMVDPEELRLIDVLVHVRGERSRRVQVMSERLLDHDACGLMREPCLRKSLHDRPEEERRDLQVVDGRLRADDRLRDPRVRLAVAEVPAHVGEAVRQTLEHGLVELLTGADDRLAGPSLEVIQAPVVHRHADDGARQQTATLEAIERSERHHLREVSGDTEDHEDVGGVRIV